MIFDAPQKDCIDYWLISLCGDKRKSALEY